MNKRAVFLQFTLHLLGWTLFYTFLYSLRSKEEINEKFIYSLISLSFGSALSSFLHFWLFKHFFERRDYKKYIISLIINILTLSATYQIVTSLFDKISFVSSLTSFTFVYIFTSAFYFAKNGIIKQVQMQELKAERLEAEMKLLRTQVSPHFLFNTLNNLYGLVLQNQNQKAADIIIRLSDLMRYLLQNSSTNKVSLIKEIQFIEDYLVLEKIRLPQEAVVEFKVSGLEQDVLVTPLLFIPLVENAFKHGIQTLSDKNFAYFSLSLQDNEIFFEAQNSISENFSLLEGGRGLENLQKRLKLMYPERHIFEIEKKDNTFKVMLQIQL